MEPITGAMIVQLVVTVGKVGGKAFINSVAGEGAKDAYKKLKRLIGIDPGSNNKDAIVEAVDKLLKQDREQLQELFESLRGGMAPQPKLELMLREPIGASCVVPKVIDIEPLLREWVERESGRMGLQSIDWTAKILKEHQTKGGDDLEPGSLESYARNLRDWYEGLLNEAVCSRSAEIDVVRSFVVELELKNSGVIPAENVEIKLWAEPSALVTIWRDRFHGVYPYSSDPAPVPPASLGLPAPKQTARPHLIWYDLAARKRDEPPQTRDPIRLGDSRDAEGRKLFSARIPRFRHSSGVRLQQLYVFFGEDPATDVDIRYELFADNQWIMTAGDLRISARDDANT